MTVRHDWLAATTTRCQDILTLSRKIASPDLIRAVSQPLDRLPAPVNALEEIAQRGLLLEAAIQFGRDAHTAFHREHAGGDDSAGACGFLAAAGLESWSADTTASAIHEFRCWLETYQADFRAAHPWTYVLGAEEYLRLHFRARLVPALLARHFGCSTAYLHRVFKEAKGHTLREYQDELRLREALRQLQQTDLKIEAVAADLGYRSKKDFYRVIRSQFGCTPGELREVGSQ